MEKIYTALGLMSGTSLDGIDASILSSDGENIIDTKINKFHPYDTKFRKNLGDYITNINSLKDIKKSQTEYERLEEELTKRHVKLSRQIIADFGKVDFVGFHGQTIIHRFKEKYSIQMGDAKLMSKLLKTKVIYNFRKSDIENGGTGAPLAPIYHYKLSKKLNITEPNIFLNIGGIANITYINKKIMKATDIGPGNVWMDEWIKENNLNTVRKKKWGGVKISFDPSGGLAENTFPDLDIARYWVRYMHPEALSKGRIIKGKRIMYSLNRGDYTDISTTDIGTLTYATAQIISECIGTFEGLKNLILCGGGRKNNTLIKYIKNMILKNSPAKGLSNIKIKKIDDHGVDGDFVESQAFAYLAIRSFLKLPISFPETTGCIKPSTGGVLVKNF
tara:strand:+ start:22 stop:1191 length:1170 start_codon:yes stop_codon:yes gene_type:complete